MVVEESLQLSHVHMVIVTKRVLHILDLVDSDTNVHALENSCIKAINVKFCV